MKASLFVTSVLALFSFSWAKVAMTIGKFYNNTQVRVKSIDEAIALEIVETWFHSRG